MEKRILAFDFGASSGRAMLSRFEGSQLKAEESTVSAMIPSY